MLIMCLFAMQKLLSSFSAINKEITPIHSFLHQPFSFDRFISGDVFVPSESSESPDPEVIKPFPCTTQLSMAFEMFISLKILRTSAFVGSDKARMLFCMLINVKSQQLLAF